MPTQSVRTVSAQPVRSGRSIRRVVPGLTAGQCFEIEVCPEVTGWAIRIPEIGAVAHATRRVAVETVARKYIAARTGIPIGYISVIVRD